MFCPKCGSEIRGNTKFCGKCGTMITIAASEMNVSFHNQSKEDTTKSAVEDQLHKSLADAKKATSKIWQQIQKLLGNYIDTWRKCKALGVREKYLWFGIHGGIGVLILCMVVASLFSHTASGGGDKITDVFEEIAEAGEYSEQDIRKIARAISEYEDISVLLELVYHQAFEVDEDNFRMWNDLYPAVVEECRNLSGLGRLTNTYSEWYDKDGLTEKLFGRSYNMDYVLFEKGWMNPAGGDTNTFRGDDDSYIDIYWYTYADSQKITFVKKISSSGETSEELYDGKYEVSGTDILVTLDGKQYTLSEASTDLNKKYEESFRAMAKGTWGYTQEFYDMIVSNLGDWREYNHGDKKPMYIDFFAPGNYLTVKGTDNVFIAEVNGCKYEQGEGKTVTIVSSQSRLTVTYDKVDGNLVLTVGGTSYVLSPATVTYTGEYDMFGGKSGF